MLSVKGYTQLGAPVFVQDFGMGVTDPNTIGTPLPAASTSFPFSNNLCPPEGSYTIARRINVNSCFNNEWIPLSSDYTSDHVFGADFGNMMIINNNQSDVSRLIYKETVNKPLCPGSLYELFVAVIDLDFPADCLPINAFPHLAMVVEDGAGNIIAADTLRTLSYASPYPIYRFSKWAMQFTMPAGVSQLVCKLILLKSLVNNSCGDDFAVDDFMLSPFGSKTAIHFDSNPNDIVTSLCYQSNSTISMSGAMDPYYPNPALQWQQSTDNGITWTDIPGATSNTYTNNFAVSDTFLFRLSGADASTIANPNCRVVSNVIKVEVDGIPSDLQATNNSPLCAGQDLKFTVNGGATWDWTGPNGFYDNIQSPHIFNSSLQAAGDYYVDVHTRGGCTARVSTNVTMIGTNVDAWPDTAVCKGASVQLFSSPGLSYSWSPATGLSNAHSNSIRVKPQATTVYTVEIKDNSGCSDTANVTVKVINDAEVKAIITGTDNLCRVVDSAIYRSESTGAIARYDWSFGNGNTSDLAIPPTQRYTIGDNTSSYLVRLAIADTTGCTDTAYKYVTVADNCYIAVPKAFTPNGDGLNDFLYPLNAYKATNLTFRIYDRWGKMVYETRDWTRKWDGTVGGLPEPADVYVWTLDYIDAAHKKIFLKGTTVLIR